MHGRHHGHVFYGYFNALRAWVAGRGRSTFSLKYIMQGIALATKGIDDAYQLVILEIPDIKTFCVVDFGFY